MGRVLLTDRFLAALKTEDGEKSDSQVRGLKARRLQSGLLELSHRYTSPRTGKRERLLLGYHPATSLAAARGRGLEASALLDAGRDPRLVLAEDMAGAMTVAMLIDSYVEKHARPNMRSHRELERRLRKNVEQFIGGMKLSDLHRRDCTRVVDVVMARRRPVEASRVFEDLRAVLRWGVARGDLDHSPMEGMRKPAESTPRDRVLSDDEISALWHALPTALALSVSVQRILRLCLVTGQRSGEIGGMRRDELDLKSAVWVLPPRRTKNGVAHTVPLTAMATEIIGAAIADAPANQPYVFPAKRGGLSAMAVAKTLRRALEPDAEHPLGRLGVKPFTSHDLRRTMLSGLAALGVSPIIAGAVANHISVTRGTITLSVYTVHSYAAEKRQALTLWNDRLAAIIAHKAVAGVLPLQRSKRSRG